MTGPAPRTSKGFHNGEPFLIRKRNIFRWVLKRMILRLPHPPKDGYRAFEEAWRRRPDFSVEGDFVWWLGHSSVLLRLSDMTTLFDPVFSKRASPLGFSGPIRKTAPAARLSDLPPIDFVAISHSHYDHLDHATISGLLERFPDIHFLVPLGLGALLRDWGAKQVSEFDWWSEREIGGLSVSFVPARHWSQRKPLRQNKSLWGGFVVGAGEKKFYFMGDSGYSEKLARIGERLGPITLAAIPIGAYRPRKLMKAQHVNPEEAVRLFREIGCEKAFAVHWGTFELSDEPLDEPPQELARALLRQNVPPDNFRVLKIGERMSL